MHVLSVVLGLSLGPLASFSAVVAGPAVQRAVSHIFAGTEVVIGAGREGGLDRYEVGAPTRLDVVLSAQGRVEEIEVELPLGVVPPAV